jgi:hypothetical protein
MVHGRAQASGQSPLFELELVAQECLAATRRVRSILRGKGNYEDAWRTFEHGYVCVLIPIIQVSTHFKHSFSTFHTAGKRYKLADIGLGEEVVEVGLGRNASQSSMGSKSN